VKSCVHNVFNSGRMSALNF